MSLLKQKQVSGLTASLAGKVESASNVGAGTGLFKQLTTTDLEFYTLAGDGMAFSAPATDIITIAVDVADFSVTKATAAVGADTLLISDSEAAGVTKQISVTNLLSSVSSQVDFADFSSVTATADGDSILFFDASNSNATQRQLKSEFLTDYAKLASPTFTGTPLSTTAAPGTDTTQIATTAFVTAAVSAGSAGLDVKTSVRWASDASIADLSSVTVADPDGQGQGITLVEGERVLVKNTASIDGVEGVDAKRNGIYVVGTVTTGTAPLTRSTDADNSPAGEVTNGMFTFVGEGTSAGFGFVLTTADPITLDTTGLTFTQFSSAGSFVGTTNRISVAVGVIDIDAAYVGQTSLTTLGTITTGTWTGTTIAVANGGTGVTSLAAQSVVATVGADTVTPVALTASTVLGRAAAGNIAALSGDDLQVAAAVRVVKDTGDLVSASMTLGTLSQTPHATAEVNVSINGLLLELTTDYTISGTTVTATNALNVSYGGTAADGLGFEASDRFQAVYEY